MPDAIYVKCGAKVGIMFRPSHYPSLSALPDRRTIKGAAVRPAKAGHEPPFGSGGPVAERHRHRDLGDPAIAIGPSRGADVRPRRGCHHCGGPISLPRQPSRQKW